MFAARAAAASPAIATSRLTRTSSTSCMRRKSSHAARRRLPVVDRAGLGEDHGDGDRHADHRDTGRAPTRRHTVSYTVVNLKDVDDLAPQFGLAPNLEARFAKRALELEQLGLSYFRLAP